MDRSVLSSRLIGALIVEKGLITEAQLEFALEEQQATGALLGEILTAQFGVTRSALETALVAQRAENQSVGADEDSEANAAVRFGLEYAYFHQNFLDGSTGKNSRVQFSAFYIF